MDKKTLTIGRVINRNFQFVNTPDLLAFKIVVQEDGGSVRKVRAVERNTNKENFVGSSCKIMESMRWTGGDECLNDVVVGGDGKLQVVGEIFARCSNMTFRVFEIQPPALGWGRPRDTLSTFDGVSNDAWLERDYRKSNLYTIR